MTKEQIKMEIQKSLDRVPESVLTDVLELLKQAENLPAGKENLNSHLREILREDKNLLERLAK
jgi:hypothetical protein